MASTTVRPKASCGVGANRIEASAIRGARSVWWPMKRTASSREAAARSSGSCRAAPRDQQRPAVLGQPRHGPGLEGDQGLLLGFEALGHEDDRLALAFGNPRRRDARRQDDRMTGATVGHVGADRDLARHASAHEAIGRACQASSGPDRRRSAACSRRGGGRGSRRGRRPGRPPSCASAGCRAGARPWPPGPLRGSWPPGRNRPRCRPAPRASRSGPLPPPTPCDPARPAQGPHR